MLTSDKLLRSSLDDQIQEAKRKAQLYAQSLKGAREHEASTSRAYEEERLRWVRTFEEKNVAIDQLERELQSAVDALELERVHARNTQSNLHLTTDQVHQDLNTLMKPNTMSFSPNRSNGSPLGPRSPARPLNGSSRPMPTTNLYDTLPAPHQQPYEVWNNLLSQYQEQLQQCRDEIDSLNYEKKEFMNKILELTQEMTLTIDEREQLKIANADLEGKLQFRTTQVREYERERDQVQSKDIEVTTKLERLEIENNALRYQLSTAERESKLSLQTIAALQRDIQQVKEDEYNGHNQQAMRAKDNEITRLHEEVKFTEHRLSEELATTKQMLRSLQLRLSSSEKLSQFQRQQEHFDTDLTQLMLSQVAPSSAGVSRTTSPQRASTAVHESVSHAAQRSHSTSPSATSRSSHGHAQSPSSAIRRSGSKDNHHIIHHSEPVQSAAKTVTSPHVPFTSSQTQKKLSSSSLDHHHHDRSHSPKLQHQQSRPQEQEHIEQTPYAPHPAVRRLQEEEDHLSVEASSSAMSFTDDVNAVHVDNVDDIMGSFDEQHRVQSSTKKKVIKKIIKRSSSNQSLTKRAASPSVGSAKMETPRTKTVPAASTPRTIRSMNSFDASDIKARAQTPPSRVGRASHSKTAPSENVKRPSSVGRERSVSRGDQSEIFSPQQLRLQVKLCFTFIRIM